MDTIAQLQRWYLRQCDEDWEHSYGVKIETLDNPGWHVTVDLTDTELDGRPFAKVQYGLGDESETSGNEWLICEVKEAKFVGAGGPFKLHEILNHFLAWAEEPSPSSTGV